MNWYSESLHPNRAGIGVLQYIATAKSLIETDPPDWIVGFSDTWYGILAQHLGRRYGIKTLIDAYDNYESYIPWAKPIHWAWRHACRHATALTAAGPNLLDLIAENRPSSQVAIVPMSADPVFQVMDRETCREEVGLPKNRLLIGYPGSFFKNRDIGTMLSALEIVHRQYPQAILVLTGRQDNSLPLPDYVINLGYQPDDRMPSVINAIDVLLSANSSSAFGDYSYPVKICEAMQCEIPIVATSAAGTKWMLRDHPECMVEPQKPEAMARKILEAAGWGRKKYKSAPNWEASAYAFNQLL
jgi:glycosyltransferase involved in cell wall biosynthesis